MFSSSEIREWLWKARSVRSRRNKQRSTANVY